jgi:YD repeat-containing protein
MLEHDGDSNISSIEYKDPLGNVVREFTGGLYTDTFYDKAGNTTSTVELGTDIDDNNAKITAFVNDSKGDQTHEILNPTYDAATGNYIADQNSIVNESELDASDNVIAEVDGEGKRTEFTYNGEAEITKVKLPDGNSTNYSYGAVSFDGTAEARKTDIVTYANGATSKTVKNKRDQIIEIRDVGGSAGDLYTSYSYDPSGNKIKEVYSGRNYKTFEYDAMKRLVRTTAYSGSTKSYMTEYQHDIDGNVTLMKDSKVINEVMTL